MVYREERDELIERIYLLLGPGIPSQECQQVDERLGEISVLTVAAGNFSGGGVLPSHREYRETELVAVPLAELPLSVWLQQQRQVGEAGHAFRPSKCLIQKIVQGQGRKPLLSADDLGDLHQVVIHDVGEMVCGQLVGPFPEHLVVERVGIDFHVPADHVVHDDDPVLGHLEADCPVGGLLEQPLCLLLRKGQGVAHVLACRLVVDEGLALALGLCPPCGKLVGGVEGVVGLPVIHELLGVLAVDGFPLGLAVGSMGMAGRRSLHYIPVIVHPFVGVDPAPAERVDDVFFGPGHKPVGIRILYSQYEIPVMLLGVQVVVESRADSAHVERPGRRGSKTYSCSSF